MEKALLVSVKFKAEKNSWRIEEIANELEELTHASGVEALDDITCMPEKPTPNFFIGRGKAEEISLLCQEQNADTVIFNRDLSGTQQRNLEELIGRKVIDRTQLILDIFARHARTPEGKTQVELAQLQYLLPRLVGKGIILSRLGGGVGTRGPGEQKLEVDRRRIRKRIDRLKEDLRHLRLHRQTLRKQRKENSVPAVALVGYTNAGKSTLLNRLTGSGQLVRDGLFTTLDPMSRGLKLPNGEKAVISDTVGFLHDLPHHLIEAFKATLEEVMEADLLVHVLDAGDPLLYAHAASVSEVLKELEAEKKPMITALNKIDLWETGVSPDRLRVDFPNAVTISARMNLNLDKLMLKIQENLVPRMLIRTILIPHSRMDILDLVYREGAVINTDYEENGVKIKANLPKNLLFNINKINEIRIIN